MTLETNRWQMYEAAKTAWKRANPGATPDSYAQAMREIAEQYGI